MDPSAFLVPNPARLPRADLSGVIRARGRRTFPRSPFNRPISARPAGVTRRVTSGPRRTILHNHTAESNTYLRDCYTDSEPLDSQALQGCSSVKQLERKDEIEAYLRDAERACPRPNQLEDWPVYCRFGPMSDLATTRPDGRLGAFSSRQRKGIPFFQP